MRSDRVIGVLPAAAGDWALAHCFMLHGPFNKQGVEWLDLAEDLFARFGSAPERATAGSGGERSFGAYKRVRKRLQRFLEPADGGPSIELDGGLLQSTGGFFQYSIKLVVNGCRSALLAVDQSLAKGHEVLLDRAAASLFAALGPAYGFAVDFPAAFGPHGYLVGLICHPKGVGFAELRPYGHRVTQCRDRVLQSFHPRQGYLREVYPTNFVLDAHLRMPFQDRPLSEYMERVGSLAPTGFHGDIHRWDVPDDGLEAVRRELETSGLVLSSSAPLLYRH